MIDDQRQWEHKGSDLGGCLAPRFESFPGGGDSLFGLG